MVYGDDDIYSSGFTVNTTLNLKNQIAAQNAMEYYIAYANRTYQRGNNMRQKVLRKFRPSDGVTEAMNTAGELFGENYLREVLNGEDKSETLEILLENLRKAIKIHAGDAEQSDDITMLALKWNGGDKN